VTVVWSCEAALEVMAQLWGAWTRISMLSEQLMIVREAGVAAVPLQLGARHVGGAALHRKCECALSAAPELFRCMHMQPQLRVENVSDPK
jgi:hypothetical protein